MAMSIARSKLGKMAARSHYAIRPPESMQTGMFVIHVAARTSFNFNVLHERLAVLRVLWTAGECWLSTWKLLYEYRAQGNNEEQGFRFHSLVSLAKVG
jgi:hypothetical protein